MGGEGDYIYLSLNYHHQNDFCIKMGSEESHFNVSVGSNGQSHRTVCKPQPFFFFLFFFHFFFFIYILLFFIRDAGTLVKSSL